VCGDLDICPGDTDNPDGTCTALISAVSNINGSGYMQKDASADFVCPPDVGPNWVSGDSSDSWTIEAYMISDAEPSRRNGYLSFDTAGINAASIELAGVRVFHGDFQGQNDSVQLWGGTQPIFGPELDTSDWEAGTSLLDTETAADIIAQGYAQFMVGADQVNTSGDSQFVLQLDRLCPFPSGGNNYWQMSAPSNSSPPLRPKLRVVYTPL